jgi:hypothetical protein
MKSKKMKSFRIVPLQKNTTNVEWQQITGGTVL